MSKFVIISEVPGACIIEAGSIWDALNIYRRDWNGAPCELTVYPVIGETSRM